MFPHPFILAPSSWTGEGTIQLNMVDEQLGFLTSWQVDGPNALGQIECIQEVQVKGLSEVMHNQFTFYDLSHANFIVELENQVLGRVRGTGVINDKVIAWEFRLKEIGFEGFEVYEKQPDDSYLMRAEYSSSDQFRTLIQGKVWKAKKKKEKEEKEGEE